MIPFYAVNNNDNNVSNLKADIKFLLMLFNSDMLVYFPYLKPNSLQELKFNGKNFREE